MFIPTTPEELAALGWAQLDVILVSGDTYIDSPYSGAVLIGKQLLADGYRVGIIAQPDIHTPEDITRLGEPALFWGVTAGAVDSMVANTTALGKPRRTDDHTPGGLNTRRPDRATIVYSNLIRHYFKDTVPIVLGGVEASLRRVAHYDFWSDSLRRSILLDAKADYLLYGMADTSVLELARSLKAGADPCNLRGLCYASSGCPEDYLEMPSFEAVQADKDTFIEMFHIFYQNNDPISARGLAQRYGDRYVIQNPPAPTLTTEEMDMVYSLTFEHAVHPYYAAMGEVRALETIRFSIPTHRGCYGECNFCAIALHEGRRVSWRSKRSILAEAQAMRERPGFNGIIHDLSGPTANMYGFECRVKTTRGACADKSCIYPEVCPLLGLTHRPQTDLLRELRRVEGVRKVFIGSGIRHDLVMADGNDGQDYLEELAGNHVSGQLKLAPEHSQSGVLKLMRKPSTASLLAFKHRFETISENLGKNQYLTYYMIAAHPGCTRHDMIALQEFASEKLGILPEQVQIFTPTPSTYSSLMYYTEKDPFSGQPLYVEKDLSGKMQQKALITGWRNKRRTEEFDKERYQEVEKISPESRRESSSRRDRPETEWNFQTIGDGRKGFDRPSPEQETETVRVVRDDFGDYYKNQRPKNWQERKPALDRRSGGQSDRQGTYRRGEKTLRDGESRYRDERAGQTSGDRPYRKPYTPAGGERSYRKPYPPKDGENRYRDERAGQTGGERPYRKPYPTRDGENRYRDERAGQTGGERPYRKPYPPKDGESRYKDERAGQTSSDRPYRKPYTPAGGERPYRKPSTRNSPSYGRDDRSRRTGNDAARDRDRSYRSGANGPRSGTDRIGSENRPPKDSKPMKDSGPTRAD